MIDVSEFVSKEWVVFLDSETAVDTREEEVMVEMSFLDSIEFFFTTDKDFDLEALPEESRESVVPSSDDSTEHEIIIHYIISYFLIIICILRIL